jgi:hypothetical protein
MDIYEAWDKAVKNTEIIRARVKALLTFQDTLVPYVILSESNINLGDTIVRQGEVVVAKPSIILPPNIPQLEGFKIEEDYGGRESDLINFLLVRGVALPSMKYQNNTYSLNVYEGNLSKAIQHYQSELQSKENITTGLLTGPDECWQFSLLIFICAQISKNAGIDIRKIIDQYKKKGHES